MIHPAWVRITHWINALAMLVMIGSGWEIYNASPLFGFSFPGSITLGGWLAGALLWHFAAMWVLAVNGLVYVALGLATGRFRRKLLPIRPGEVIADAKAALTFRLAHDDLSKYNAVQRLLYAGIIVVGVVIVLSGLVDLEAGAAAMADRAVRRLRRRALRAFLLHGGDRRIPGGPRAAGAAGAEEPARHDQRKLNDAAHPHHHSRRRSEAADQGRRKAAARSDAARCCCAAA